MEPPELSEVCEVCGYEWAAVGAPELPARLRAAAAGFGAVYAAADARIGQRPDADTWSPLEYGGHVRDVLLNLRERIILGIAEDNPTPKPMFAAVRMANGLYDNDDPATLTKELEVGAGLLARTVAALTAEQLSRPLFYPYPRPETRTIVWVASQALHEAEHHLGDVRALMTRPDSPDSSPD